MNKYTERDYINKCNEFNLTYKGYTKEKKKGIIIKFICPKHKEKGEQLCDWSHFHTYTYGCKYCSGRGKTNEDIEKLIKNKDVLLISEYKGNEKPINCKCNKCGNEWTTLPKVLITNGSGCPTCGRISAANSRMKTQEEFVQELYKVNPDIEVIGEYKGVHTKCKCRCKLDGFVWGRISR